MKRLVLGKILIDGTGGNPLREPAILIEDGCITEILPKSELGDLTGAGFETVDCTDKAILPGLIDYHVHLTLSAGRDHDEVRRRLAEESERELLPFRAVRNAQRALLGGVTTLRDAGGVGLVTLRLKEAIQDGLLVGPRLLTCGMPITTRGGHLHYLGLQADEDNEIREAVRMLCDKGVDGIKVIATGGVMTSESNPLASQYTADQLRVAVQEAHRLGRKVEAHVLNTAAIDTCVRVGVDLIAHCVWAGSDGETDYRPDLAEAIARKDIYVGMTASGFYRSLMPAPSDPPHERRAKTERLRDRVAPLRKMWEAGVRIMVHSDAGVRFTDFDTFAQSVQFMELALGVSPMDAIVAATKTPAEGLGIADKVGTIEVGKRGDLLAVAINPLEDTRRVGEIGMVMKDGEIVVANGKLALEQRLRGAGDAGQGTNRGSGF